MFSISGGFVSAGDAELVARCLDDDDAARHALVQQYQRLVFSLCLRMLGQREDAEDVTQEVFLRMFRSLATWDSQRPFRPWLLTIATNRCRTFREKRARQPVSVEQTADIPAPGSEPAGLALQEELQRALNGLRYEYATCFILYYQQDLAIDEIGRVLDRPPGTIKTWLHRARRDLAEHLRRRGFGPETQHELQRI